MIRHDHWPAAGGGHAVPHGTRDICFRCGKAIVFIEGYELRRSYWRTTTARHLHAWSTPDEAGIRACLDATCRSVAPAVAGA